MDQIYLDPQDKLPPTPRTCYQQNTLPPQDKKVPAPPPPPRIISGTALTGKVDHPFGVGSLVYTDTVAHLTILQRPTVHKAIYRLSFLSL